MPTISQLPLATDVEAGDQIPLSQGGIVRAIPVATLLQATQAQLTLATGSLLGRVSNGPGGPEAIALGTGLQISNDVLEVDHSAYPQTNTLNTNSTMLLNGTNGSPQLMPISLLRGLYAPGANVSIDVNGVISSTPVPATGSSIGAVAVGNALVINASGQLSVNIGTVSGTVASGNDARIVNAEQTNNKGAPNGYAPLNAAGMVPAVFLPPGGGGSGVSSIDGRSGNITLTTADIGGLGSIATQSASAVNISGGIVAGAGVSGANAGPSLSGSTNRTLAARFSDSVNVNDFGLARDGITDDSAKFITACQVAANGKLKLYIPSGGPILLTDAAQQNLTNLCIYGDGIRDYSGPQGYGHVGSTLWFTGTTKSPFLLGPNVQFEGLNFFWPNQTEAATVANSNLPIVYPPLFAQQSPAQNIVYFRFVDCQVTNCYDFFTAIGTVAVVGACTVERCMIYAIRNCFTLQNVPEVFFIANTLFTWGTYGSVVSVGPTYNLRNFTNTQATWLKVVGDGTPSASASTTVGGIMSSNNYVYGASRGIWLAAGTLDISSFVNTGFDTVPTVIQGDPGCAFFSTRITGGAWYPIYYNQTGSPDTTAIVINTPAQSGTGCNLSFSGITVPFVNGSLCAISGTAISSLSFNDIRCNALGHTTGGTGPYYAFQLNVPNANVRIAACDISASNGALSNTGVQVTGALSVTVANCMLRNLSAPIDVESTAANVTLIGNTTVSTQATTPIAGIGTTNIRDLNNNWDKSNFVYNGFAPAVYRAGATIGVTALSCTAAAGYVGIQPSATGSGGGTRFGVTSFGTSPVSLLTNNFNEEQLRVNRQISAVNYVGVRGSVSGSAAVINVGGADAAGSVQLTGTTTGVTLLGSPGATGSTVVHLGAQADQSYAASMPSNGFSINMPSNSSTLLLRPTGTLSSGTVVLPAAAADGEKIQIWSSRAITALIVNSAVGAVVNNGAGFTLAANASVSFFWNAANNTWFQDLGGGSANGTIAGQNANNVAITGGSITGLSAFQVGGDAAVSANVVIDTAPGYARQIVYESAGLPRWVLGVQGTAENTVISSTSAPIASGASSVPLSSVTGISVGMLAGGVTGISAGTTVTAINGGSGVTLSQATTAAIVSGTPISFYTDQGSDFAILPYDDTGAPLAPTLGQSFLITRATGQVSIKTLSVAGTANAPTPAPGDSSTAVATTAFVANAITTTAVTASKLGVANGVATLDATGHIPAAQFPATVQGALNYQGAWNAATNTPALSSGTGTKGFYYTVSTPGSTTLDGISQWNAGDHAAYNGTNWEKFEGLASEVVSVAGRTGNVTLTTADIGGLGSLATQAATAVAITGGTVGGLATLGAGSNTGGLVTTTLNSGAGSARQVVYQTAGTTRWNLQTQGDAEATQVALATTAASSTTTLTFAATTGVVVGMSVAAAGIASGTLVTAVAATTVTLSATATGVTSGESINFYPNAGSSFALRAYDDGGNLLFAPLSFSRAPGAAHTLGTLNYGPLVVQGGSNIPGGTRGVGAADLQQYRTASTQVASGAAAFTAGQNNIAAGIAGVALGSSSSDRGRTGTLAMASGAAAASGDTQTVFGLLRAVSTTTAGARLTADGAVPSAVNVWNIASNTACLLRIEILGWSAAGTLAVSYTARCRLKRGVSPATTVLSNTTLTADADNDAITGLTAPTLAADTANGGLGLTSGFSTANTLRWAARVISAVELQ